MCEKDKERLALDTGLIKRVMLESKHGGVFNTRNKKKKIKEGIALDRGRENENRRQEQKDIA